MTAADEVATNGVRATLADGTEVRVGKPSFIEEAVGPFDRPELEGGAAAVHVSVGKEHAGVLLSDPLRPNGGARRSGGCGRPASRTSPS